MKICLINNLYEPFSRGGAEKVVEKITGSFEIEGHKVFIIATKPYFKKLGKNNNIKIYRLNSLYYDLNLIPIVLRFFWHVLDMFDFISYYKIKKILDKEKPDLVMTHNLKGLGFLIPFALKEKKIEHIHTLHDVQLLHPSGLMIFGQEKIFSNFFVMIYQKINKYFFRFTDIVISPSNWLMEEHIKKHFFLDSKKVIVPNPVQYIETAERRMDNGKVNILYVGQIGAYKGLFVLLDVFESLKSETFDKKIVLTIAGAGEEEQKLKDKIKGSKNILFIGRKTSEEIKRHMKKSDFLIVPSLCYENSPTVIYEAASLGLPVIASRIGGISELAYDLGGVLFNPGDRDDLKKKIIWAIKNAPELEKIGERSREKIKKYDFKKYINVILKNKQN